MPDLPHRMHDFASRQALADALASTIAGRLSGAIAARGQATLALSGGTTPALFFAALANAAIDWPRVTITLVDERFVEPSSPRSNEGLVRRALLTGPAAAASFVPLYRPATDAAEACRQSAQELATLEWPLDAVVLGMGADGHTASFFPDAVQLASLLDPASPGILSLVSAPSAGETRLTLTLPRICGAHFLALHIEGDEKRGVIGGVLAGKTRPPIGTVLANAAQAVQIYWAP